MEETLHSNEQSLAHLRQAHEATLNQINDNDFCVFAWKTKYIILDSQAKQMEEETNQLKAKEFSWEEKFKYQCQQRLSELEHLSQSNE